MRRHTLVILALLSAVLIGDIGCAHPKHYAVVVDTALYESLADAHALEQQILCGAPSCAGVTARVTPAWSDVQSQAFNRKLLPAVEAGSQFNQLLAEWQPGEPPPARLHDLIVGLTSSLSAVAADFPDGTTKTKVLADLTHAQSIALTALDLVLYVKGGR